MSECNHDCGSCSANCDSRKADKSEFLEALNPASSVKKVIGVVSGKGGVGKSLVTSMLAVSMNHKGKKTAVLDADITGPSIPMAFGIGNEGVATSPDGKLMLPAKSMEGVEVMSANLLLDKDTDPVIWRGPVIAGVVKQFWNETAWGDIDYLFVDMPPGTGDVPLTVFQSLPVDGIVIVTSPQELVNMIVKKAYNMAEAMHITVLGVVENFSYLKCPDCGKEIKLFGESHIDEIAKELSVPVLGKLPLDTSYAAIADKGDFYSIENDHLAKATEVLEHI